MSRVGNSLIGFSSELLVFCERKNDLLVKKRDGAKSDGTDLLLDIKKGKNCEKLSTTTRNMNFFKQIALF